MPGGFGGAVKLTGESEYRKALNQISQNLREVASEMKVVSTSYASNDKSTKSLKAQQEVLNKTLTEQAKKLETLKAQYSAMSRQYTEQSNRHNQLLSTYEKEKSELDRLARTVGTTSREYQVQKTKVTDLASEVRKSTTAQDANEKSMSKMRTEINNAQAECNKTSRALDTLGKEEREAGEEARKASEGGFTIMKGVLSNLATQAINTAVASLQKLGGAFISVGKQAISNYGDYEQLVGGVETLFKDSADIVQEYARNAFQTAGLSANEYMETVTSFSASLLQGLGGDTQKAAEMADLAITDMSDNANKMGTDMASIQHAYQGFAKQNFTMLDNLKLGYGGTASEMARLINDSGVLGDSFKVTAETVKQVSFADMISAIHVVQTRLGITGTTALEASTTIQGSARAMQSAWQNMLTGLADDNADFQGLTSNLVSSLMTYLDNVMPRITTMITGMGSAIPQLLESVVPEIMAVIPPLLDQALPMIVSAAQSIIDSCMALLPQIVSTFSELIPQITSALLSALPSITSAGGMIITSLVSGVSATIPELVDMLPQIISDLVDTIVEQLPYLVDAGVELLIALSDGLIRATPQLIAMLPEIISKLTGALFAEMPKIIEQGYNIIKSLVSGVIGAIPQLVAVIPQVVSSVVSSFSSSLPQLLDIGKEMMQELKAGMDSRLGAVKKTASNFSTAITDRISVSVDNMKAIGEALVKGLWDGIKDMTGWIVDRIKGFGETILGGLKSFFGIHSPSRVMADEIGEPLADGIAEGFQADMPNALDSMENSLNGAVSQLKSSVNYDDFGTSIGGGLSGGIENGFFASMKQMPSKIMAIIKIVKDVMKALPEYLDILESDNPTDGLLTKILGFDRQGLLNLNNRLKAIAPKLAGIIKQVVRDVIKFFSENIKDIVDVANDILIALLNGITESLPIIIDALPDLIDKTLTAVLDNLPAVVEAGFRLMTGLGTGMLKLIGKLPEIVGKIIKAIVGAFADLPKMMFNIGKQAVEGIIDGMKDFIGNVGSNIWSGIKKVGSKIVDGFKSFFRIGSPSKLMRDQVGIFLAQGIGVGFEEEMKNISRQMQDSVPSSFDIQPILNGIPAAGSGYASDYDTSYGGLVSAFKEALSEMKIELDDNEVGQFVDRTVTRMVYS